MSADIRRCANSDGGTTRIIPSRRHTEKLQTELIMRCLLSLPVAAVVFGCSVVSGACAGDAAKGEHEFAKCAICHAKDKTSGIGPGLFGVVGRHAGSVAGFGYSPALKESNIVWDEKSLDAFITEPQKAVPGNTMPFPGIPDQGERDDLIAYLQMLK
jgi:cytochrome c